MRSKIGIGVLGVTVAFLLATNPVVVNAAGQIGSNGIQDNSIKSKDIKDNQLRSADVKDGSLTSADIGDGGVSRADLAADAVDSSKVGAGTITTDDVANGTLTHADLAAGKIGVARGYAWINDEATPLNVATPLTNGYTYNSAGGAITVTRTGVGEYNVTFTGVDWAPGHVQVTAYSSGAIFCNSAGWGSPSASVACFNAAGAAANARFTVAVFE